MSDYTKLTNYAVKDGYTSGNPAKVIKGTELDDEFNAISTAISTKVDSTDIIPVSTGGTGSTTAADARTALGAAKSGANNDITSLSGLTTALSVAQGGTGATTANAALNTLLPSQTGNANKYLQTNGANASWTGINTGLGGAAFFSSSSTWTAPAGITRVKATLVGGGGGGGGNGGFGWSLIGAGGGGGATVVGYVNVTPGTTYTVTVGSGGAGSAPYSGAVGPRATSGSASVFAGDNVTLTAGGGQGGNSSNNGTQTGGAGGTASGSSVSQWNINGFSGSNDISGGYFGTTSVTFSASSGGTVTVYSPVGFGFSTQGKGGDGRSDSPAGLTGFSGNNGAVLIEW